jgi:hypothetical protein
VLWTAGETLVHWYRWIGWVCKLAYGCIPNPCSQIQPPSFPQGANGAGKTTTFKVVTGEVTPDAGDVSVTSEVTRHPGDTQLTSYSVLTHRAAARRSLGYCPQFDGLPAAMTGGEAWSCLAWSF